MNEFLIELLLGLSSGLFLGVTGIAPMKFDTNCIRIFKNR